MIIEKGWRRGGSKSYGKPMGNVEIRKSEIYNDSRNSKGNFETKWKDGWDWGKCHFLKLRYSLLNEIGLELLILMN